MADTNKEKSDNLMLDVDSLMEKSGFSTYIFFCVGDNKEGGFASVRAKNEEREMLLQAQIIDTLEHNPQLKEWFKNILDNV